LPTPRIIPDGKLTVAIDFGGTCSAVAYGSSRIKGGEVQQILTWPGASGDSPQVPTCLLYDREWSLMAWGFEAKNAPLESGQYLCENFKSYLGSHTPTKNQLISPGRTPHDLMTDFLSCLWDYAKSQIRREVGRLADFGTTNFNAIDSANFWVSAPATWNSVDRNKMRAAAVEAEMVKSSWRDRNWQERLKVITESEAATAHCAYLTELHKLKPGQHFIVCDAGGNTVDVAIYRVTGSPTSLGVAQVHAKSGTNCGSAQLDVYFEDLIYKLLAHHPLVNDAQSMEYLSRTFREREKLIFAGGDGYPMQFHLTYLVVTGIVDGNLRIPGTVLRSYVFDPVIREILNLLEIEYSRITEGIDALFLVGGFSNNEYLLTHVERGFDSRVAIVLRPPHADLATCRGAAQYGLTQQSLVSQLVSPKAYMFVTELKSDEEDRIKRPAYIDPATKLCRNRLKYLVNKGALVQRGQKLPVKFGKLSASPQDHEFVLLLHASESSKMLRYTDEGSKELCRWTVNLSTLPSFQQQVKNWRGSPFITKFYLALEIDSTEVRGYLMFGDEVLGEEVFDHLS
ncbi:hypothetical protein BOTBODRAFT_116200, partial [Botryobasidium botryosum FD-172 SS1]